MAQKENDMFKNCDLPNLKPRERIIHATLHIIGEEGLQGVTVRKITARADVNIGALNYYFGSKEETIDAALTLFTKKMFSNLDVLDDPTLDSKQKLKNFLLGYSNNIIKHPGLMKSMVGLALANRDLPENAVAWMNQGFKRFHTMVSDLTGIQDEAELARLSMQIIGSMAFPLILGKASYQMFEVDVYNDQERLAYIDTLVNRLCYYANNDKGTSIY